MQYLTNIDMAKNQILNAVFQNLTVAPSTPIEGQFYWNTTDDKLYIYTGADWVANGLATATEIVALINSSASIVDLDNLPAGVATAITNNHTHTNKAILDLIEAAFTSAMNTKLAGIAIGAEVNAVKTVCTRTGDVVVAKTDVGLGNVTNDAQIKKLAVSTNGSIPKWNGTTGDALLDGYTVETALTGGSNALPRADAVKTYIDGLLATNDAMVYKGTLGSGGTITAIPTTYNAGWTYRVITAATYAGIVCEIGDLLIAIVDRAGSGNLNADWTIVQTNADGLVIGPASATDTNFAVFSGTTGKLLANSTYNAASFALAAHIHNAFDRVSAVLSGANIFSDIIVTDGIVTGISTRALTAADIGASATGHTHAYTGKYVTTVGSATSVLVTHNLNSRDLAVTLRETAGTYQQVIADIEFTSVNTLTVKFAVAPSAGQYTITVIG